MKLKSSLMWGSGLHDTVPQTLQMSGQPALDIYVSLGLTSGAFVPGVPRCSCVIFGLLSFCCWTGSALPPKDGEYFLFVFFPLEVSLNPGKLRHTQTCE